MTIQVILSYFNFHQWFHTTWIFDLLNVPSFDSNVSLGLCFLRLFHSSKTVTSFSPFFTISQTDPSLSPYELIKIVLLSPRHYIFNGNSSSSSMPSNRLCVLKRTAQGHDTTWEKFDTSRDGKMSYHTNKISLRSAEWIAESVSTV